MIETNLANCECDCRNILQLISWLTAAVVVLGLCSLTMLVITLYLFKKSRADPYNQNIELVPFGNKVPSNQHKINSFTCLELKETTRILFDFTILFYNKKSVTCAVISEFRLINTSVMLLWSLVKLKKGKRIIIFSVRTTTQNSYTQITSSIRGINFTFIHF